MSRRPTVLRIVGIMPDGREYRLFFLPRGRVLCCLAGPVGIGVPIVVRYRGSRKKALRLKERIRQKGFRKVSVRRLPAREGAT